MAKSKTNSKVILPELTSTAIAESVSTFEKMTETLQVFIDNREVAEDYYRKLSKFIAEELVVTFTSEEKESLGVFFLHPERVAAYDPTNWTKVQAVSDFLSNTERFDAKSMVEFTAIVDLIASSKFVSFNSVNNVAIPVQEMMTPKIATDSRIHRLSMVLGDIISKLDMEIESGMKFPKSDWDNAMLIYAQKHFALKLPQVENL